MENNKHHKVIAWSFLIGIIGVSIGMILGVSGFSVKIVKSMSDWKTYVNQEHGFSFQYPPDWKFYQYDKAGILTIKVSNDVESFSVTPRDNEFLVDVPSRRAVIAGKNALIVDRSGSNSSKSIKDVYFYDPVGFRITVITNAQGTQDALRISKTLQFL